jgi:hypothetical protein
MVREGWSIDWYLQVIEHGEGGVEYRLVLTGDRTR